MIPNYIFQMFGYGIYIHDIQQSDPAGVYHNHPWNSFSLVLGEYWESRFEDGHVTTDRVQFFNFLRAKTYHRIIINTGETIRTIVFHGPKCNDWNTIDSVGTIIKN
jgi:hypothetical protein